MRHVADPNDAQSCSNELGADGQTESAAVAADVTESLQRRKQIEEAYKKVPSIGEGGRWYDIPYRLLVWCSTGWRRRLLPRRVLDKFNFWINYLLPFNEHQRHLVSDSAFDFTVPDDEHVTIPDLWVVELFPPSEFPSLEHAIEKNAWDRRRHLLLGAESNREMLSRSRAGTGPTWWSLAEITRVDGNFWSPDATREKLSAEFEFIQLKAIQLGQGLTAVVARFTVSDTAARKLDEVWHAPHEPKLVRTGRRPRAEDREWAAYRVTQEARHALHEVARDWLRRRCPGFFAAAGESQPLLDLILMDRFDPLSGTQTSRADEGAFRALGLTEHGVLHRTSKDLPKLALVPTSRSLSPGIRSHRTMALWGQRGEVTAAASHLDIYGSAGDRAIASRYDDGIQNFLVTVAVSDFLEVVQGKYAALRDTARTHHGRFKPKVLEELREHLLTLSLDLQSMHRDQLWYWKQRPHFEEEAEFTIDYAPHIRERDAAEGRTLAQPEHLNKRMREQQSEHFEDLIDADRQYRDILSTAASLGVSLGASRTGRRALLVAAASLLVALVSVLGAEFGSGSVLRKLVDLFQ